MTHRQKTSVKLGFIAYAVQYAAVWICLHNHNLGVTTIKTGAAVLRRRFALQVGNQNRACKLPVAKRQLLEFLTCAALLFYHITIKKQP